MKIKIFSKSFFRFVIFLILILVFIFFVKVFQFDKEKISTLFRKIPLQYSSFVFILLYIASNFFITGDPKEVLKFISAIIFGLYLSSFLIYIAEIINAILFFYLSRFLGREFTEKYLKGRFKRIYYKIGDLNFYWIFLLRLNLLIPYRILDICFGLSAIHFKKYILVVLLASFPRIFFLQFIISVIGEFSIYKMQKYLEANPPIVFLVIIYIIFSIVVIFKSKKKLW